MRNHTTCGAKKCQGIHRSGKGNGRYRAVNGHRHTASGRMLCICKHCKKYFTVLPWQIREYKNQRIFCSRECCQMYMSHKQGKECTVLCFRPSARQRVVSCEVCERMIVRYVSELTPRNKRIFCSPACNNIGRQRRVLTLCALCGSDVRKEGHKMTAKTGQYFCGNFCKFFFYEQRRRRQTIYTPEFIRSLINHGGEDCPFSGCEEVRAPTTAKINPWGLCATHASRVYDSLSEKRRIRERILSAHNP